MDEQAFVLAIGHPGQQGELATAPDQALGCALCQKHAHLRSHAAHRLQPEGMIVLPRPQACKGGYAVGTDCVPPPREV